MSPASADESVAHEVGRHENQQQVEAQSGGHQMLVEIHESLAQNRDRAVTGDPMQEKRNGTPGGPAITSEDPRAQPGCNADQYKPDRGRPQAQRRTRDSGELPRYLKRPLDGPAVAEVTHPRSPWMARDQGERAISSRVAPTAGGSTRYRRSRVGRENPRRDW